MLQNYQMSYAVLTILQKKKKHKEIWVLSFYVMWSHNNTMQLAVFLIEMFAKYFAIEMFLYSF